MRKPHAEFESSGASGLLRLYATYAVTYPVQARLRSEFGGKMAKSNTHWSFPNATQKEAIWEVIRPHFAAATEKFDRLVRSRVEGSPQETRHDVDAQPASNDRVESSPQGGQNDVHAQPAPDRRRFASKSVYSDRFSGNSPRARKRACKCTDSITCIFCASACCPRATRIPDEIGKLHTDACFVCEHCNVRKCADQPECRRHYFLPAHHGCRCTRWTLCSLCAAACCPKARRIRPTVHALHTASCFECDVHGRRVCQNKRACRQAQVLSREDGCECSEVQPVCRACTRACQEVARCLGIDPSE